ncbi:MAG: hypothetical protein SFZ02_21345 [bacterium]|nr:hypothetical protein [bacterium]
MERQLIVQNTDKDMVLIPYTWLLKRISMDVIIFAENLTRYINRELDIDELSTVMGITKEDFFYWLQECEKAGVAKLNGNMVDIYE